MNSNHTAGETPNIPPHGGTELEERIRDLERRVAIVEGKEERLTMVLFSGELDKAMAAFVIANGAAALGKEVTIFATFWGLDAFKKQSLKMAGRGFLERVLLWMRPKGLDSLPTSQMNLFGIGPRIFGYLMKRKNIYQLRPLVEMAIESGVRVVACQMSLDVMGLRQEDLIDGIEFAGVTTFLSHADEAQTTVFI